MQTDVKAGYVSTTATVFNGRTRFKGLVVTPGSATGTVVVRDGGASGTTLFYNHLGKRYAICLYGAGRGRSLRDGPPCHGNRDCDHCNGVLWLRPRHGNAKKERIPLVV